MRDKLDTTYSLTIRPEYQALTPLVAQMNGWNGQGDVKQYLSNVVNEQFKSLMRNMIEQALNRYYGLSQQALIDLAMIDYDGSAEIASTWSEVE